MQRKPTFDWLGCIPYCDVLIADVVHVDCMFACIIQGARGPPGTPITLSPEQELKLDFLKVC